MLDNRAVPLNVNLEELRKGIRSLTKKIKGSFVFKKTILF